MNKNTYRDEDRVISEAKNNVTIESLIEIIDRLDGVIEEWKDATNCGDPEEFIKQRKGDK